MLRPIDVDAALQQSSERLAALLEDRGPAPAPLNVRAVSTIGGWRMLAFGDEHFLVPPVPYVPGARLDAIQHEIERLNRQSRTQPTERQFARYVELLTEAVGIMHTLVRPLRWRAWRARSIRGRWVRWRWKRSRNPFAQASESEVGMLFGFFSDCRRMSRVRQS